MERRIATLEKAVRANGCATCKDWSAIEVVHVVNGDEPIPPSVCPDCGRDARKVIVLKRVDIGPQ